ncbi:MAG TPA: Mov34/MPN/PAD-1 family protein [Methanocorpusculum sp.]|nr:Mov34/MPN/PAD-1 family protein [Methanocorpusculum sp.]
MLFRAIAREVLNLLLEMGKSSSPDEFIAMLGSERDVITTVYPIAGTTVTSDSATICWDMVPLGMQTAGTAHSHPNGALWPSDADLQTFAETGQCHIIVGDPFEIDSWRCFDREGREMSLEVVSA